jgi:hypothetical protein
MESLVSRDKSEAKKKGVYAAGPFLAVPAGVGAVYLTYKWFMYRAKRGMRF